jgi:beta-glucanase (GH16 family)
MLKMGSWRTIWPLGLFVLVMMSGRAAPLFAATPDLGCKATAPIDASYKLVFDDEFDGKSIDTQKWQVLSSSTMTGAYATNEFVPGNAAVSGGLLRLAATRGSPSGRPYSVAFVFTRQTFLYGYWETRAKMPEKGTGLWPAFWMNDKGHYPEIDVFEWLGNQPNQQWTTYHPTNDLLLTQGIGLGAAIAGPDYSSDFHIYGMLWQPGCIAWFIDGKPVLNLTQGQTYKGYVVDLPTTPMSTILDIGVGGWDHNVANASTQFPGAVLFDYVHIYSNDPKSRAINRP